MAILSDRERAIRQRLKDDFEHYASRCLKIRTKAGHVEPFTLNRPQRLLHDALEAQRRETGKVRALVLKARQWGCSTYVEGRYYWRATHRRGCQAFILTHEQSATDNLFGMAQRFHDNCPAPVKPQTGAANAKEMSFNLLDSGYKVGTAGSKEVGRSQTVQLFHGSEVAFWPNAANHVAGVMQAVPNIRDTEVILESTANGIGGLFYDMCMAAIRGDSEYILVFVPWFEHEEYTTEPPKDWECPPGWRDYGNLHGLTLDQVYWAWAKNRDLASACSGSVDEPCWLFRQEYPATVDEAFQAGGTDTFIRSDLVMKARKAMVPDQSHHPLIFGVDIARGGGDKTRIIDRLGRCAGHLVNETIDSGDLMDIAGRVAKLIDRHDPDAVFLDVTGLGAGVYDALKARNYRCVHAVNFGSKPAEGDKYLNKRAEMWGRMRDWFEDEGGADLVDDEGLHTCICAPGYKFDSYSRTVLEPKEDIKKRLGFSPDGGDALALTFAETVHKGAMSAAIASTARTSPGPRSKGYNPLRRYGARR